MKTVTLTTIQECRAYTFLEGWREWDLSPLTFGELRALVKMKRQDGYILPGQEAIEMKDGENFAYMSPEMHKIAEKVRAYDDAEY